MEKKKQSIVLSYTGEGKGKTSAAIGQVLRMLGHGGDVAFVQFIKEWKVSEHKALAKLGQSYNERPEPYDGKDLENGFRGDRLTFYKGGKGFYHAGNDSAKDVSDDEHKTAAMETFNMALRMATSDEYDLVVCDEINNAVSDGLISVDALRKIIQERSPKTSLCLTGRGFPPELLELVDIATEMRKEKHYFDDGFLALEGIEY